MTRKKKTKPVLCAEAEFEASMTHTSVQSLFQGLGLIQDGLNKAMSVKVKIQSPGISGFVSVLPSGSSPAVTAAQNHTLWQRWEPAAPLTNAE